MTIEHSEQEEMSWKNLYLIGFIEEENVLELIQEIHVAEDEGVEMINLYINTEGGRVDSALSLANTMLNSHIHFNVFNMGLTASAGMLVYFAGNTKYTYGTSLFMIHGSLFVINGMLSKEEMDNMLRHNQRDDEIMNAFVKTLLSESAYNKFEEFSSNKEDNYFSAKEAIDYEMADTVINPI